MQQPQRQAAECRFAAAAFADEAQHLARRDRQRHAIDRLPPARAGSADEAGRRRRTAATPRGRGACVKVLRSRVTFTSASPARNGPGRSPSTRLRGQSPSASAFQQRARWPARATLNGCAAAVQRGSANGQRGANTQPASGLRRNRHLSFDRRQPAAARCSAQRRTRGQQPLAVGMRRPIQHAAHAAEFDELAGVHHRDVVAEPPHHAEIVADEQQADALLLPQPRQQAQDLRLHRHVQRRGRFVEDQQRRLAGECRGDQRALLHPAAELMRKGAGDLVGAMDAHLVQQRHARRSASGGFTPRCRTIGSAICRPTRSAGIERGERILEHRADPAPQHRAVVAAREPQRSRPSNRICAADPRCRAEEIQDRTGDAALAGAGFADDAQRLAWLQTKRHVAHGRAVPP